MNDDQLYAGRLTGNCKHSGTEYDNLTGYVVKEYTMEWTGEDGTRWRKTCTVINLGKPDRSIPVDPDKVMNEQEPLAFRRNPGVAERLAREREERKAARHAIFVEQIRTFLVEHGPHTARKTCDKLKIPQYAVLEVLREHRDIFTPLGGNRSAWGVVGIHHAKA